LAGSGISRKRPRLKRPMVATPPPFAPTIERTPFRSSETPVLPPWLSYHRLHDGRLERGKVTPRLLTSSTCDPSGATLHFQVNEALIQSYIGLPMLLPTWSVKSSYLTAPMLLRWMLSLPTGRSRWTS